jgi:hypothetical protein
MEQGWRKARGPLDDDDRRRLVLKVVARLRCVVCGQVYNPHDFALVGRQPDAWVLSVECHHCGSPGHVVVAMPVEAEPKPIADPPPDEMDVVGDWPPITRDDVLDVHELLEEFFGDIDDLFSS